MQEVINFIFNHWKAVGCILTALFLIFIMLAPRRRKMRGHWFD